MATTEDHADTSGKTGGLVINQECDLCGSTTPITYCPQCEFTLCPVCSKGHGKIQATKDHSLLDIFSGRSSVSDTKSGDGESGPSLCRVHSDKPMELYCEECAVLICEECSPNHFQHTVRSVKNNLKAYQNICTQHIKSLLDKAHDLDEHKSLVSGVFTNYDTAIQTVMKWEEDLVQLVQECSYSLREELKNAMKDWEDALNDRDNGLVRITDDVDSKLSKLHSIRKVTDVDIFSHELAASQELLAIVNQFMENTLPKLTIPTVDALLPNKSYVPTVKSGIVHLMTPGKVREVAADGGSTFPVSNIDSLCEQFQMSIPDSNSVLGYGINKSYSRDKYVMIYGTGRDDIRILNIENKTLKSQKCSSGAWNLISTDDGEYVAVKDGNLNLLNSKFEVIKSLTTVSNKSFEGVAFISKHRFVVLESDECNDNHTANISIVNSEHCRFSIQNTISLAVQHKMFIITSIEDKRHVYICGNVNLYKISLKDGSAQHLDMTPWVAEQWSLCAVDDYVLIGDSDGKIHWIDNNLNYIRVILDVSKPVTDMAVVNGFLVVSTEDNRIICYKK